MAKKPSRRTQASKADDAHQVGLTASGAVKNQRFLENRPHVSREPAVIVNMNSKTSLPFAPGSALHGNTQSVALAVAALRKARGKLNPDDVAAGTREFEALELDFLRDMIDFLSVDPNEHCWFDD
ncbi:hypothetical protein [Caballeronia sp. GACF4]|uniref:hypothetical protein n=1 Tax=Caballeronia sp. GACF4 TaxID=2921763 RepID=UPI0020295F67|nr:hypothetical protein [Caballeronia sp. GACF4]